MSTDTLDTSFAPGQNRSSEQRKVPANMATTMNLICTQLEDPNFQAPELLRLVTLAIALLVKEVRSLGFTAVERHIARCLFEHLMPLRELRHSIRDTDSLREQRDVINWQGEAIHHVIGQLVDGFVQALTEAGLSVDERNTVMRLYRDWACMYEPLLRRETER